MHTLLPDLGCPYPDNDRLWKPENLKLIPHFKAFSSSSWHCHTPFSSRWLSALTLYIIYYITYFVSYTIYYTLRACTGRRPGASQGFGSAAPAPSPWQLRTTPLQGAGDGTVLARFPSSFFSAVLGGLVNIRNITQPTKTTDYIQERSSFGGLPASLESSMLLCSGSHRSQIGT